MSTGVATQLDRDVRPLAGRRTLVVSLVGVGLLAATVIAGIMLGNVSLPLSDTLGVLGHRLLGGPPRAPGRRRPRPSSSSCGCREC